VLHRCIAMDRWERNGLAMGVGWVAGGGRPKREKMIPGPSFPYFFPLLFFFLPLVLSVYDAQGADGMPKLVVRRILVLPVRHQSLLVVAATVCPQ